MSGVSGARDVASQAAKAHFSSSNEPLETKPSCRSFEPLVAKAEGDLVAAVPPDVKRAPFEP